MAEKTINIGTEINPLRHTIIGGATGNGKSVAMNGYLLSVMQQYSNSAEYYLFDIKRVEFARYQSILPVYKTIEDIEHALKYLHQRMMDKYEEMEAKGEIKSDEYVFIFIDEIGVLLNHRDRVRAKAIKSYIEDFAMLGRAAGFFLICATQYVVKECVPMIVKMQSQKIVLKCDSDIGYRVMSDRKYYDLQGPGDAYIKLESGEVKRFQVNYYSDELVKDCIEIIKKNNEEAGITINTGLEKKESIKDLRLIDIIKKIFS